MMKEREREREKRLSPLLFRLPESRTDEQSSGALKGQRPGPTGALRVSLFFSSLSLSALYNIACVYIYIPTFVGRRKICEKKGKAAHTNTEEKKKEREKEKKIEFRLNTSSTMSFQPWSGSFFLFLKE